MSDTGPIRDESQPQRLPGAEVETGEVASAAHRLVSNAAALTVFGLQFAVILAFNALQYSRFALTKDFAADVQALSAISHGHLNPTSTVLGTSFWRINSEFVMWPLALVYRVLPHPIWLLFLQDAVLVLTEIVAFAWIREALERRVEVGRTDRARARAVLAGAVGILVITPWVYESMAFDFHVHTIAALFVVLAGRDLWRGRGGRVWLWALVSVFVDSVGSLYLAGVGLSGVVAGRSTRRTGALLLGLGAGWFAFLGAVHGDGVGGTTFGDWYGYLVPHDHGSVSLFSVLAGAITHPQLALHVLENRWTLVVAILATVGLIGAVLPWGFGVAAVVFLPALLNANPLFLRFHQSFQFWAAIPFVLSASCLWVERSLGRRGLRARLAVVVAVVASIVSIMTAVITLPTIPDYWISVTAPAAARLADVERVIPSEAEIVASNGIVGRFGAHDDVYVLGYTPQTSRLTSYPIPLSGAPVVFVIAPRQGVDELPAYYNAAIGYVRNVLHAKVITEGDGIHAFLWRPPAAARFLTIPEPASSHR